MSKIIDIGKEDISFDNSVMLQMHDREINQQITTAKKFPRVISRAMDEILTYATENEDTAQECIYAIPRAGKKIIGPTARFAEIVGTSWGNSRYAARIIDEGPQFITAQAVFHDLEKNTFISVEVPRRIIDSNGDRYGADMIGVTSSAAMSIAMRNAILKGVPRAVWGRAYEKCLALISGTFETIEARRTAALKNFHKLGVDQALVLKLLEIDNVRDMEPDHIVVLRGTLQAIKDGDTTVNAVFGGIRIDAGKSTKADISGQLERGKANGKKAPPAEKGGKQTGDAAEESKADSGTGGNDDFPGDDTARNRNDGSAGGDGNGNGGGVSGEAAPEDGGNDGDSVATDKQREEEITREPLPDGMIPEGDEKFSEEDYAALERVAYALLDAKSSKEIGEVTNKFTQDFEARGTKAETAFAKMVADRRRALRGSSASKL